MTSIGVDGPVLSLVEVVSEEHNYLRLLEEMADSTEQEHLIGSGHASPHLFKHPKTLGLSAVSENRSPSRDNSDPLKVHQEPLRRLLRKELVSP